MNIITILKIIGSIILFIFFILGIRQSIAIKKEKRVAYYSLEPISDKSVTILDRIFASYHSFVKSSRRKLQKRNFLVKKSKKYEKYIKYKNRDKIDTIDFITNKLLIGLIFLLITIFSQIFTKKVLNIYELILNYLIGYYLLDIYLFFDYRNQIKLMENELLRAVIIMNNAFKAGKSTLQALKIASEELPEPLCDEFKKMYFDMKYGLSVDTVFERFAKRASSDTAIYLSSSLTILNKTGGNIVQVFSSIERTLFDKKKLEEELKNITASSNMIIKLLFVIPFIFIFIICVLNPKYFSPLLTSPLGYLIIFMALIMLILYIIILKKIMKVGV